MENKFMSGLKTATNYAVTENGALTHKTMNQIFLTFLQWVRPTVPEATKM